MTLALTDAREVKKHVSAIHIGGKLSLLQRKLYNVLLYNSYDELLKKEKHQIKIRELCELSGFDSNNQEVVKDVLTSLSKTSVTWNLLGDDDVEEWGVTTMLAEAVIRKGVCTYAYSPSLREKLYKPELYARINLSIMSKFTGSYSFALYENTVRFRGVKTTGWRTVEFWRSVLGVVEGEYRLFKDFNKKVLKPAIQEVSRTSDILLDVEYRREKRRVTELKFNVKENPQMPIPFPIREKLLEKAREEAGLTEENEEVVLVESAVLKRLLAFGIPKNQAEKIVAEHDDQFIEANLDIVEKSYEAGKVENLPAYTIMALKTDFRPKMSPYEAAKAAKKEAEKKRIKQESSRRERLEQLRNEWEAAEFTNRLNGMGAIKRKELEKRFHQEFAANVLYQRHHEAGLENPVMKSLFRGFAYRELMRDVTDADFEASLKRAGNAYNKAA